VAKQGFKCLNKDRCCPLWERGSTSRDKPRVCCNGKREGQGPQVARGEIRVESSLSLDSQADMALRDVAWDGQMMAKVK
jgi:hypothetical protein